jgi:hypothetical protein
MRRESQSCQMLGGRRRSWARIAAVGLEQVLYRAPVLSARARSVRYIQWVLARLQETPPTSCRFSTPGDEQRRDLGAATGRVLDSTARSGPGWRISAMSPCARATPAGASPRPTGCRPCPRPRPDRSRRQSRSRKARVDHKADRISDDAYTDAMRAEIDRVLALQEDIGLDVLVHGEPERNDMVQYVAGHLTGFAPPSTGWPSPTESGTSARRSCMAPWTVPSPSRWAGPPARHPARAKRSRHAHRDPDHTGLVIRPGRRALRQHRAAGRAGHARWDPRPRGRARRRALVDDMAVPEVLSLRSGPGAGCR